MTKDSLKRLIKEKGLLESCLYYAGRLCSKIEEPVIGKWLKKHGRVCETRLVFKNREMQDMTDNARAFFEYLLENGYNEKYQIVWLVSRKKKFRHLKYKNVKFVTAENRYGWNSCRAYYYANTAKYFLYTNNTANLNRYHCGGQVIVNLWHGCGYKGAALENKNIPRSETMGWFDYAIVPGPVFVETKSEYWQCPKEKILPLGYPRYDWMLDASNNKKEILDKLFGWKEEKTKTVIWMPTFRKSDLLGYAESEIELPYELPAVNCAEDMKLLDKHCKEHGILLIIKKHPLQLGWSGEKQSFTNIRYVTEKELEESQIQLYRLVSVCDAMISDYSSIAVDFVLLDRPLGFVLTDYEMYKEKRGFVFEDPLSYMPGEKIYNFDELKEFLEHVGNGTDLFAQERKRLLPEMHNQTEHYCARIAEYLNIKK